MVKHTQQFAGNLPTNCLSVFDHFVQLALKRLRYDVKHIFTYVIWMSLHLSVFKFFSLFSFFVCLFFCASRYLRFSVPGDCDCSLLCYIVYQYLYLKKSYVFCTFNYNQSQNIMAQPLFPLKICLQPPHPFNVERVWNCFGIALMAAWYIWQA